MDSGCSLEANACKSPRKWGAHGGAALMSDPCSSTQIWLHELAKRSPIEANQLRSVNHQLAVLFLPRCCRFLEPRPSIWA